MHAAYDEGKKPIITLTTGFAHYMLGRPSREYLPHYEILEQKVFLSKLVFEFILDEANDDASYDELVDALDIDLDDALTFQRLGGEELRCHAHFVLNQV